MGIEKVTLHGLTHQDEWQCAWESVRQFALGDGDGKFGRRQGMSYDYTGPQGEAISIGVWRSKHGLNAIRVKHVHKS